MGGDDDGHAAGALVGDQDDIDILLDEDERRIMQPTPVVNRAPIDPADEVWDDDDIIELEDGNKAEPKKAAEPVKQAPAQMEPIKDDFEDFDDVFAGDAKKADKKQDVM